MIRGSCLFLAFVFFGCSVLISSADPATPPPSLTPPADTTSAVTAPPAEKPPVKPVFLTGDEKVWSDFPKAPALNSDVDQLDIATILLVQASRTPDQITEAMKDKYYQLTLMTDVIDSAFQTKYVNVYTVLGQADKDAQFITTKLKDANARLRPYEQHPDEVQSLFPAKGFSYPSGHSSGMELQARILATLFHTNGQDLLLLKRAQEIAESRVVAGVHNPSDVKAGIDLGNLLFAQLEANPQFVAALAAAAKADNIPAQ